mmetsp:Transcript_27338/g.55037  ORF Transcript_27338/g.55037 Transcript_27338/m.55037 type:complete len:404 (-) Transcript_27338:166-1377(-)
MHVGTRRLSLVVACVQLVAVAARTQGLCAVGDLHGDPIHALHALKLCGAVNDEWQWTGGKLTVVQVGDVLDRGNASLPLLRQLWSVQKQATVAGGELLLLVGNHELLNMQGATRYVHPAELHRVGAENWREVMHPQHGEYGKQLAKQPGAAIRGEGACRTLFLHAGLRLDVAKHHGSSLTALNVALRAQLATSRDTRDGELLDPREGPLWWRGFARPHYVGMSEEDACTEVRATLDALADGAQRMTVGHNIVPFVSARCEGELQMIDVGMSSAYDGRPAAWRCTVDVEGHAQVRALYETGEEEPPDLCTACSEMEDYRAMASAPLHGLDPQDDCPDYCPEWVAAFRSRRRRAAKTPPPSPSMLSKTVQEMVAQYRALTSEVPSLLADPPLPSGNGKNNVKTEF